MRVAIAVCALVVAGCLDRPGVECADGRLCPSDTVCDEVHHGCVLPDQLHACDDLEEGDRCPIHEVDDGVCRDGVCIDDRCGDGLVTGSEECDGEALRPGLVDCTGLGYHGPGTLECTVDCTVDRAGCESEGICGDGVADAPFEQCDDLDLADVSDCMELDYYDPGPVGCTALCRYDVSACSGICGDHIHDPEELCEDSWDADEQCLDFGYDVGALGCSAQCAPSFARCAFLDWHRQSPAAANFLDHLWSAGPDEIWATLGEALFRFDGTGWAAVDTGATIIPTIFGITGSGPDDVWVFGFGDPANFDGTTWTTSSTGTSSYHLSGWALPGHLWLGDADGNVLHRDGTGWTVAVTVPGQAINSIWASSADDVWAIGNSGTVMHRDATGWSAVPTGATFGNDIWGSGPADIWIVGNELSHWDGATWTQSNLLDIGGAAKVQGTAWNDVWALDFTGAPYHFDGVVWTPAPKPDSPSIVALHAAAPDQVWAAGAGGAYRYRGAGWGQQAMSPETGDSEMIVHASRADDVWACRLPPLVQNATLVRWDGAVWQNETRCLPNGMSLGPGDAWFTVAGGSPGSGTGSFDGTSWTIDTSMLGNDLWMSGPDDVWLVSDGSVWNHDGVGWSEEVLFGSLAAVWGTGPDDVWITGGDGAIHHFTGGAWEDLSWPTTADLWALWGSGPADVYFIGDGLVLHYDGVAIGVADPALDNDYLAIWGSAPDDVWIGGKAGRLLHFDGTAWSRLRLPAEIATFDITALAGVPRHVWLSAISGDHLHHFDRSVRWSCRATELGCGDAVDDDCDGAIDDADSDCATAVRLAEVSLGGDGFVEVINRTTSTVNLTGLQLVWQLGCDGAKTRFTFPGNALVGAGARFRVVEDRAVGARERWLDDAICDGATSSGWAMLCAGPCDVVTCRNLIDVVAFDGPGAALAPPACAAFSPAPVDVTAAGAGDAVVRAAFTGTGAAADWTVSPATRD